MTENVDFVNSYIERLNKTVHDLTGRNVVLETRLEVAEKTIGHVNNELEQTRQELSARSNQIDQVRNESKQLNAQVSDLRRQLAQAETALRATLNPPEEADEPVEALTDLSTAEVEQPQIEPPEPDDF